MSLREWGQVPLVALLAAAGALIRRSTVYLESGMGEGMQRMRRSRLAMMTMLALAAIGWSGSAVAADIVHESLVYTEGWAQNSLNATSFRQSSVTSRNGW